MLHIKLGKFKYQSQHYEVKNLLKCHIIKNFHRSIVNPIFNIRNLLICYCIKVCSFWKEPSN